MRGLASPTIAVGVVWGHTPPQREKKKCCFLPARFVISPYWITSPPRIVLAAACTTPVLRCPSMAWDHKANHRLNPNSTHGSYSVLSSPQLKEAKHPTKLPTPEPPGTLVCHELEIMRAPPTTEAGRKPNSGNNNARHKNTGGSSSSMAASTGVAKGTSTLRTV